jgi:Domain of unknown function (DUF4902)
MRSISKSSVTGYVRLPKAALRSVELRHLFSEIDLSIAIPGYLDLPGADLITGITEWGGTWTGASISVGWDWGVVRGVTVVVNPAEIRTNLLIVEQGEPESPVLTRIHLLEKIESVPWTSTGIPELLAKHGRKGSHR